ncbi:C40 family peptidase [Allochromatium palmeri]|uniref:NlpC/P60 family protein n=1 Tax=Allochromatium palmeri TaxID=231048 RepID=A0A6N8ECY9_9GAMM|nr:C40 family peptidase [Allochromatium palmeri]MTW20387.1 NlpC/P60 family protein [Allochromatium palmeri]
MKIRASRKTLSPLAFVSVSLLVLTTLTGCASRGRDDGLSGRRAELVDNGLAQIGTRYLYGGESPKEGFDCSGLTQYAHSQAGLAIPRTAAAQHRAARPVARRRLQPGDMVFFKTGPNSNHVGLMIDGKRFVHASTSRSRVRIDYLDTPYWNRHYVGAGTYLR